MYVFRLYKFTQIEFPSIFRVLSTELEGIFNNRPGPVLVISSNDCSWGNLIISKSDFGLVFYQTLFNLSIDHLWCTQSYYGHDPSEWHGVWGTLGEWRWHGSKHLNKWVVGDIDLVQTSVGNDVFTLLFSYFGLLWSGCPHHSYSDCRHYRIQFRFWTSSVRLKSKREDISKPTPHYVATC